MTPSTARSSQRLAPHTALKLALRPSRAAQLALTEALSALAPQVQPGATLVDLGPLAGQETARVASALVRPRTIQLAGAPGTDLEPAARRLAAAFPETDVLQVQTGRSGWPAALPPHARRQRIVHVGGAWPWWMGPVTRRAFFSRLRRELRGPDLALVSFLPVRDGARIEQAWEAAGPALAELLLPASPVDSHGRVAVRSFWDPAGSQLVVRARGTLQAAATGAHPLAQIRHLRPDGSDAGLPEPLVISGVFLAPDGSEGVLLVSVDPNSHVRSVDGLHT